MITRIEARNYKALEAVGQDLKAFQILIGPNASGKSTFLDVPAFMGDIINSGVGSAIKPRARFLKQLTFNSRGGRIELAVEITVPPMKLEERLQGFDNIDTQHQILRYEIALAEENERAIIAGEWLLLLNREVVSALRQDVAAPQLAVFGDYHRHSDQVLISRTEDNVTQIASLDKNHTGLSALSLIRAGSALASVPEDVQAYGAHLWVKRFLSQGVKNINLDGEVLREPGLPADTDNEFSSNGSNLAFIIKDLQTKEPKRYKQWLNHLETALPDIKSIVTQAIPHRGQRFLIVHYQNGTKLPSWLISDGSLRIIALTLIPYLSGSSVNLYLIEEPENGVHPRMLEAVFQSLSSVYHDQVFIATHSAQLLTMAKIDDLIIFQKDEKGAVTTTSGPHHPYLADEYAPSSIGIYFASGILS